MISWTKYLLFNSLIIIILISGCSQSNNNLNSSINRLIKIPANAINISSENDDYPPILYSKDYEKPIPLNNINTLGVEDSPFIDGNKLYFFFTPSLNIPVEKQLLDKVSGIYFSEKINNRWTTPKKVILQDKDKLALDGCEFVQNNSILFCSVREGYEGVNWFSAEYKEGEWINLKRIDFNQSYNVGELHITSDGKELYYHSSIKGGVGGLDIWMLKNVDGEWKNPTNIKTINSEKDESMPFITLNKKELWFSRKYKGTPAIYRSKWINNSWQEPELIISQFAGEPTLDSEGNIYFVHHYYKNNTIISSDIYVAYKK